MVKVIMDAQGSYAWHKARLGIPTASEAASILTPKTEKPASAQIGYAHRLVAERILNASGTDLDGLPYLQRGKEHEPAAVADYEFITQSSTYAVGFLLVDSGRYGASPDRLISDTRGGVEVKAPAAHTHVGYLLAGGMPDAYRCQVAMQMLVGELDYVDFFSWHPRCPPFLLRTHRDEPFIAKLRDELERFCDLVDAMEIKARSLGHWSPYPALAMPTDGTMADGVSGAHAFDLLDERETPQSPLTPPTVYFSGISPLASLDKP